MKTVFFIISICFFFYDACAQTVFEEGNLQDVFLKAKKEGKMVMIVGSATWCAPCQALKKNVFPTKEAGNYFNANFVLKRYELDKADPDQVVERYRITAYPTTVILNADGHELARILGGAEDAKGFIEKIRKAISPDNLFDAKKKKKHEMQQKENWRKNLKIKEIVVTEEGTLIDLRPECWKISFGNWEIVVCSGISIDSKLVQPLKRATPSSVTVCGKTIFVRLTQSSNALFLMDVIWDVPKSIDLRETQS